MTESYFAHETAIIDQGAQIGVGTQIWHFSHIMGSAVIGERCTLGQNVFIAGNVRIGNGVKIQNNVSVYEGVTLEDDVFCGPSMVFTNDLNPRAAFPKGSARYVRTHVKRGSTIGANATVVGGISIGEYAFVGAGAVVTEDVPNFAVAYGVPARIQGWMCVCGERLEFVSHEAECVKCGKRYRKQSSEQIIKIGTGGE